MIWLLTALTLCSIGQLPCARGGAAEPEAGVVEELTPESMSAAIQGSEHPILVDFYAPWCGSCKKLSPLLDKLAAQHGDVLRVGKIDATRYADLAETYEVKSYPKIKFFLDGEAYDYSGPRNVAEFAMFANRLQLDRILAIHSKEELQNVFNDFNIVILLKKAPESQDDEFETAFVRAADSFRGSMRFVRWAGALPLGAPPISVSKLEKGIEFEIPFVLPDSLGGDKEPVGESLKEFTRFHNRPYISTVNANNFKQLGKLGKNFMLAVLDMTNVDGRDNVVTHEEQLELFRSAALSIHHEIQDSLVLGVIDSVRYSRYLKKFAAAAPSLLVVNIERDSFFLFDSADIFESTDSMIEVLREAKEMQPSEASIEDEGSTDTDHDGTRATVRKMKSLHHHVGKKRLVERMKNKFIDYYPYSLLVCLLPTALLIFSMSMTNPRNKKKKAL